MRSIGLLIAAALGAVAFAAPASADVDGGQGSAFSANAGQEFNGRVATFHATGKEPDPGEFKATIAWGDGPDSKSAGTVAILNLGGNDFEVRGAHTYQYGGTYPTDIAVTFTAGGTVTHLKGQATVSGPPPPAGTPPPAPPKAEPPKAVIAAPTATPRNGYLLSYASKSTPGSTSIVTSHWDWGDGKSEDHPKGATYAAHVWDQPGTYKLALTVTDENGLKDSTAIDVQVKGAPNAVISIDPKSGKLGTTFKLRGDKSSVPGGKIVTWEWDCFDGSKHLHHIGSTVARDGDGKKVKTKGPPDKFQCKFSKGGQIHLEVTSDQGESASASTSAPVRPNQPPSAAFKYAPSNPAQGQEIVFDASASKPHPDGSAKKIDTYHWDWGDGTSEDTQEPVVSHSYDGEPGKFVPTLTVQDAEGQDTTDDIIYTTAACVSDIGVRGLSVRANCLRKTACEPGHVCYEGLPDNQARLNGVTLSATGGGTIFVDTTTGYIGQRSLYEPGRIDVSYGPFGVNHPGAGAGSVSLTVPEHSGSTTIGGLGISPGSAVSLHGFKLGGSLPIVFGDDGTASITINVKLPKPFKFASGSLTANATNDSDPNFDEVHLEVNDVPFTPFHIQHLAFDYDGQTDSWSGAAQLYTQAGIFSGGVGFTGGSFDHLSVEGDQLNIPLAEGFFLQRVAGSYTANPFGLSAGVGLSLGPQLEIPGVTKGVLIRIDGDLKFEYTDKEEKQWHFAVSGTPTVIGIGLPTVTLDYSSAGAIGAHTGFDYNFFEAVKVTGTVDLAYYNLSLWQADSQVVACATILFGDCDEDDLASGEVVLSSVGVAACAYLPGFWPNVGGWYRWGESFSFYDNVYFSGCDIGPVKINLARTAQNGSRAIQIEDGAPSSLLGFVGQDGAPSVTLTGPNGEKIVTPASGHSRDDKSRTIVAKDPAHKITYVLIARPAAGKWTATVDDGSTPLTAVRHADGLPAPSVRAKVTGSGTRRRIDYAIKPIPGQRVKFSEQGVAGGEIGFAKGARGSLKFTPAGGPRERRRIVAEVIQDGAPRKVLNVAAYTAPRVVPAKPRFVRLRRRGASLVVTWARATGAKAYHVDVTTGDGRAMRIDTRARTATIPGLARYDGATATVAGYSLPDYPGKAAKGALKAPSPPGQRPRRRPATGR